MNTMRKILSTTAFGISLALAIAAAKPRPIGDVSIKQLDLKHASGKLTDVQKQKLLDSFLAGHPEPVGVNVCCCQPGWQVYDQSKQKCTSNGKLIDK